MPEHRFVLEPIRCEVKDRRASFCAGLQNAKRVRPAVAGFTSAPALTRSAINQNNEQEGEAANKIAV
jgi:hypothetical protein